ncbi:pectinesterase [Parastagonospora nodorum]|uniref:pectinesterase n=1 Tax=Phaeosphaeria nodorum (strain SN15 / ATCC MYA-4574 / FGSC 10173) TaxID=321614 RepID=A0A7U2EPA8_PHANO|nr:pectinesterase [Parastagonospora nodorum]QRC90521.1 pectinesterase [Parastagonospora nodorum SN15]KAH3922095.1 pectinesterase [Parastagonospora nodorum]KAH3940248.1 pectinesterase [Parastagonospora nodorum]KAH3960072.1 pectinesterase [Parastagonospora nodorum]
MRMVSITIGLLHARTVVSALDRVACQHPSENPLEGCPENTILVGQNQKHTTVQSAILSLPNDSSSHHILIQPGNYTEQVNVTRPGPVYLLGQTRAPNDQSKNVVSIIWRNATGAALNSTLDNAYTSTLTVAPTFNSSKTGSGPTGDLVPAGTPFGNVDFRAYNIDFINDFKNYATGPALAVSVSYANAGFYFSGFYSYQDTVYVGKLGNAYFYKNEIAGQTDFLYGFGTAWIQSSLLTLRNCGGGITAWKGTNTTFVNKYGVYIHDSDVRKANASLAITGLCALGRPWNALHRSIFANCNLDDSIKPSGYIAWGTTDPRFGANTTMAEYKSYGPGWNATARAMSNVSIVMSDKQYEPYSSLDKVFQHPFDGKFGNTGWIDRNVTADNGM